MKFFKIMFGVFACLSASSALAITDNDPIYQLPVDTRLLFVNDLTIPANVSYSYYAKGRLLTSATDAEMVANGTYCYIYHPASNKERHISRLKKNGVPSSLRVTSAGSDTMNFSGRIVNNLKCRKNGTFTVSDLKETLQGHFEVVVAPVAIEQCEEGSDHDLHASSVGTNNGCEPRSAGLKSQDDLTMERIPVKREAKGCCCNVM